MRGNSPYIKTIDKDATIIQEASLYGKTTTEKEVKVDIRDPEVSLDPLTEVQQMKYPKLHLGLSVETMMGALGREGLSLCQTALGRTPLQTRYTF